LALITLWRHDTPTKHDKYTENISTHDDNDDDDNDDNNDNNDDADVFKVKNVSNQIELEMLAVARWVSLD